jgi:uroporphyrinogen III methyltransferase/synthase
MPTNGKVYIVGAGPGDPGLLTLRGAECLRRADVVLYDYLAAAEVLESTSSAAELVCLGRHGRGRLLSQDEINDLMVRHARQGRTVVRLKGGDPAIFARLAEELAALESADVPYEIVPGVTAAQAASSHAGIPLTTRDDASCVAFVTGQESAEKQSSEALDYAALARFPGTLVFYMGVTTAADWSRALVAHGKAAATPVAIARRCSLPDQETIVTTLGQVGALVKNKQLRPPAVMIVGDVARATEPANWFTSRPLFGKKILVTRPEHQSQGLAARLRELGASVLCQPAIEISEPPDWSPVDRAIEHLADYRWIVFSSSNGVYYLVRRMLSLGHDVRRFGSAKLAAIGPATVAALAAYHLKADVSPAEYRAEALADSLTPHVKGQRVLLARASRGREVLAEMLSADGADVSQVIVYESRDVDCANEEVIEALVAGRIDWVTVTSSAIARSLVRLFGDHLTKTKLAAISPLTAEVLRVAGNPPAAVAKEYTSDGIVAGILASMST